MYYTFVSRLILLNLFYFIKMWNSEFLTWLFLAGHYPVCFLSSFHTGFLTFSRPAWAEPSHPIKVLPVNSWGPQQFHPHQIWGAVTPNLKSTVQSPPYYARQPIPTCSCRCYSSLLAPLQSPPGSRCQIGKAALSPLCFSLWCGPKQHYLGPLCLLFGFRY